MKDFEIKGDSFSGRYKRTNSYAIDSTEVWDTEQDAKRYARNVDTEAYVPYAGQIVAERKDGKCYQLVEDVTVTDYPERKHFKLVQINNANEIDDAYLSRDKEDTAKEKIHFLKGVDAHGDSTMENLTTSGTVKSSDYSKGSSGYSIYKDADGNYHLEIYHLDVRGKMSVDTLEIKQSYHVKGAQWMTKASMIVSRVAGDTVYFNAKDADGNVITNDFKVGDFAYCATFNLTENRMYWRDVTGVGDDFITLGAGITDVIKPGDSIVQLGNATEKDRQGATCMDSESVKIYMGIKSKSLPAPFIDLDPVTGAVIKAKFINEATGNDINDDLGMLNTKIESVKEQTDKQFVIWFEEYNPTLLNLPASDWTDDATKAMHGQDIFYNTSKDFSSGGGRAYRFEKDSSGVYDWIEITDKDTIAALEAASKAQDTADGKRRVFVSQPKDSEVYDIGDMWVNVTFSEGSIRYENDMLVCKTAKKANEPFSISHWKPASTATTAYLENLGDRILAAVTDSEEGIEAAKRLANKGIEDAYAAAQSAVEALGIAMKADGTATENTAVIQVMKDSIAALVEGVHFDKNGKITNINTSGLVTTDDFNTLLSKKVSFDEGGHVTNISTSGLVTTEGFSQLFSEKANSGGYVKRAYIDLFVTELPDRRFQSNAEVNADLIRFNGNIVANGTFVVDKEGNLTMNNLTAKNLNVDSGTFRGDIYADNGIFKGEIIQGDRVNVMNADGSVSFCNGKISWGTTGTPTIEGKIITSLNGKRIELDPETNTLGMYDKYNNLVVGVGFNEDTNGHTTAQMSLRQFVEDGSLIKYVANFSGYSIDLYENPQYFSNLTPSHGDEKHLSITASSISFIEKGHAVKTILATN